MPFGAEDMAGDVLEWGVDKEATNRVIRGGSWYYPARYCRAAYRNRREPTDRYYNLGFRVASVPSGGQAGSGGPEPTEPGT